MRHITHIGPSIGTIPSSRRLFLTATLTALALTTASVGLVGTAARADDSADDGVVNTQEMLMALENVDGELIETPARASSPVPTSDAREADRNAANVEVILPESPSEGVSMQAGDFSMRIALPFASKAEPAETLQDGSVAYPSIGASANAVIPTARGAQLLTVIDSKDAPESYAYDLSLPAGTRLEASADGGARVIDEQGLTKVEFQPAWAQDSSGKQVPTRYEVKDHTLTQVVDHRNMEDVAYPIVADPLPLIVIVVTSAALIVVAALALGVATWLVVSWWNICRAQNKWPELSTRNGFTARCVR